MSSGLSDINPSAAPYKFAGPDFFYSNLRIQEALTTLRYGIEARKGLTIITGAAGMGKSTLIYKAAAQLAPNTTCVFESDPRVNFSDILRLILCHLDGDELGGDHMDGEESAMVRNCRIQLRARLDQCQIVALFLDNADQFPEQTLRRIIETFLVNNGSDSEATLLQVILAGRTDLTRKFSQATLRCLNRRRPIVCELQPLNSSEIAAFIEKGLITSNHPLEIFDERAVKRIALYANGNPGTVSSICERALQLAGGSTEAKIPAELIESAAADLNLRELDDSPSLPLSNPPSDTADFDIPKPSRKLQNDDGRDRPYKFPPAEDAWTAPPHFPEVDGVQAHARKRRRATGVLGFTLVILVGLVGFAALRDKDIASSKFVSDTIATLRYYVSPPYLPSPDKIELSEENASEKTTSEPLVPLSGPDHPVEFRDDTPAPTAGSSDLPSIPPSSNLVAGRQSKPEPNVAPPANQERQPAIKLNSGQRYENLQTQIVKAIENRAIMGIEVSVVQGTAYLDGHVATERQRRAAERAARSVAGVERVRNRIAITFG